ncbi:cation diffusion facilitator family transporter [Desulfovibrio gilichinskyi]|uniref:Cation diffusion facilitator family transporter n=1 Tax=Desulfovibrio gilichinskyi TaxID=1519643 RepID=A0A1X7CWP1_9BACT|nr:cation transporter [Desulfovibrio gilichinskyi]SMF04434.1 cation diffusion facilitator family transporter [Desulfovibrio gilichinskyi]
MSRKVYTLSQQQLDKESAVFWAIILDTTILTFLTIVGTLSGSMTALSEIVRFALLLSIEYISYVVLRRAHRGKFSEFEFGIGKIERITNLVVAFGLLLSSMYIFSKVISMTESAPISTNNLMLTIVGADLNLLVNYYFSIMFIRSNQTESSVIISSQISARIAKTVASFVVLGVLMLTLWIPDPKMARMVDLCGSLFLTVYMVIIAYGLIKESLPEILDRTIPEPDHYQILRILAENFDQYDGFSGYKARRAGKDLFILLKLCFFSTQTLEQIEARLQPVRKAFEAEMPGSSITIETEMMCKK